MKGHASDRRWDFWLADHGLAMGGLALTVGAATSWWAISLGSAALAIAFFAWVAEADGLLVLPRLGRVAIRTGGGEPPLSFSVRRGARVLLFVCEEYPERGGWSDVYTVLDRPVGTDGLEPCYGLPPNPLPSGWALRGLVPVSDLQFESHERSTYVTRGSLERALSAAGV